jgi:hypothetical protein
MHILVVENKARWEQLVGLAKKQEHWRGMDKWKEPEDYPALGIVETQRVVTLYSNTEEWDTWIIYITKNDLLRVLMPKNGTEQDFLAELMSGNTELEDRVV